MSLSERSVRRELPPELEAKAQAIRDAFLEQLPDDSTLEEIFDIYLSQTKQNFPLLPLVGFTALQVAAGVLGIESDDPEIQFMIKKIKRGMRDIYESYAKYNNLHDPQQYIQNQVEEVVEAQHTFPHADDTVDLKEIGKYYTELFTADIEALSADPTALNYLDESIKISYEYDSFDKNNASGGGILGLELAKEFYSDIYTRLNKPGETQAPGTEFDRS